MNFFAQQERARARTRRMLILFLLAVAGIVGAIDFVLLIAFGALGDTHPRSGHGVGVAGAAMLWTSLGVLALIALASLYKIAQLRSGGGAVARQLGAVRVEADAQDFAYRRLRHVVEEMAIAAGVPVPEIYVLENEPGINAFAAGFTPSDAAITVTRGCLDVLTRDELQGVIAHEFSHILNGDMRLNIRLMGVLFGILVIGLLGRKIIETSGRSRDSGSIGAFGFAILAIGYIGVFFGRLIKASISRQREYLADASAVQFTRQTDGIVGALKKIGALAAGSTLRSGEKEEVAHMLFGDGVGYAALFATHPPLAARIKALDPRFDPQELARIAAAWSEPVPVGEEERADVSIAGFAPAGARSRPDALEPEPSLPHASATIGLDATRITARGAAASPADLRAASAIRQNMPADLCQAAYAGDTARQLIFALTLDTDGETRTRQLHIVEEYFDAAMRSRVERLAERCAQLHPLQRLPLAQMAFPALRRLPRPELQTFLIVLHQLIQADGVVRIEEYCLAKLIGVQVVDALDPAKARPNGTLKLPACAAELADLFAVIAEYGASNEAEAARAYQLGMHEVLAGTIPSYATRKEWAFVLDRALPKLDRLAPAGKELLVQGLIRAIAADGVVTVREAELLRTVCAALHCPLPPLLDAVPSNGTVDHGSRSARLASG
jgi:Zn-dependent protease with chaperone function